MERMSKILKILQDVFSTISEPKPLLFPREFPRKSFHFPRVSYEHELCYSLEELN